jgi:cellulose synthase/poly-beta-1,6-N-acetylglucosamine synthase-like glycosyltransferase
MVFMSVLMYLAIAILCVPVLVVLIQALSAFASANEAPACAPIGPRIAVLIPAHNEASGIAATIESVRAQLGKADRIVVVADNCSDQTASVARLAGAEVAERTNTQLRGKGYALDHGVRLIALDPPEILVIIDADCLVSSEAIARISALAAQHHRPVQAKYLMYAAKNSNALKKVAEFAWVVKNQVRPIGFQRLGLPSQLTGSGMAFPWDVIRDAPLANGHIAEDMQLGIDLASKGFPPLYCADALVSSYFPNSAEGTQTQRTRWEHGTISILLKTAPTLLFKAIRARNLQMIGMALDLLVPPIALLCMLVSAAMMAALLFAAITGLFGPAVFAALVMLGLITAVLAAWWRYGRAILPAYQLLTAIFYMLKKIPLYFRYLASRQVEWVRSKRDGE